MNDVDRITAVLEEHWLHHDNRCRCDKSRKVLTGAEWRVHAAEQIATELLVGELEWVPCPQCGHQIDPERRWCPKCLKWTLLPAPDSGLEGI